MGRTESSPKLHIPQDLGEDPPTPTAQARTPSWWLNLSLSGSWFSQGRCDNGVCFRAVNRDSSRDFGGGGSCSDIILH